MSHHTLTHSNPFRWWHLPLYPLWGLRWLFVGLPRAGLAQFQRLSPARRILAVVVILVCLGALGGFGWQHWWRHRQETLLTLNWKLFEESARQLDTEEMARLLRAIRDIRPEEPLLALREKSLAEGEGDPGDALMTAYWMNRYLAEQKLERAVPEAKKRVAANPKDWQARCILADWDLRNGKRDSAIEQLRILPSPAVIDPPVVPALHSHAEYLLQRVEPALNKTDREDWWEPMMRSMREYRVSRLLPVLKSPLVERFGSLDCVQLLECYLKAFEDLDEFPNLPSFWVPASRVCQQVVDDPKATPEALVRLGEVQLGLLEVLDLLIRTEKVTEEATALTADLEERLDATWARVRVQAPKNLKAFLGLARLRVHQKKVHEAVKLLEEAHRELGSTSELLLEQAKVLQQISPQMAMDQIEKTVQGSTKIEDWFLYFQTALRAARPDKAMLACREARKLEPKLVWAAVYDAELSLSRDRHADALEALTPVRSLVARSPEVARLYVRAFLHAGAETQLQSLLKEIDFDIWPPASVVLVLRELLGPERHDLLVPRIDKLVERAPDVREVRALQADVYRQAAEPQSGTTWDRKRLDVAFSALRWLRMQEPENLQVVSVLSFLQLKALGTPDLALRTAEPLRQAQDAGKLPPSMQLTLGAIYLQVGRYDEARRILETAAPRTNSPAGWIDLGLACFRLNRTDEARAYLQKAASLPRLPRETEELNLALKLVEGN